LDPALALAVSNGYHQHQHHQQQQRFSTFNLQPATYECFWSTATCEYFGFTFLRVFWLTATISPFCRLTLCTRNVHAIYQPISVGELTKWQTDDMTDEMTECIQLHAVIVWDGTGDECQVFVKL
jgi:hypothetical protein